MLYEEMMQQIFAMETQGQPKECPGWHSVLIGKSIFGRSLPLLSVGHGKKSLLILGPHRAKKGDIVSQLLRFVQELSNALRQNQVFGGENLGALLERRALRILPMPNPDGTAYALSGVDETNLLYDRLLQQNQGSRDFSSWTANGRGVSLPLNYPYRFAERKRREVLQEAKGADFSGNDACSEPETASICRYFAMDSTLCGVMNLENGDPFVAAPCKYETQERCRVAVNNAVKITGYPRRTYGEDGDESLLNAYQYFFDEYKIPAFLVSVPSQTQTPEMLYHTLKRLIMGFLSWI